MEALLNKAVARKQKALSEFESKQLIKSAGVLITNEKLAQSGTEAVEIAQDLGFPVVLKGCSHKLMHKTELGLVKLNLRNISEVENAYEQITESGLDMDGVLVQEMISGNREFVIGMNRDPQFGPCVMFGLGGVYTEVLKDVIFRVAPISESDAAEMLDEIKTRKLLDEFRGDPAIDRDTLVKALVGVGDLGNRYENIAEIDINPVIISGNRAVAVDALVILK